MAQIYNIGVKIVNKSKQAKETVLEQLQSTFADGARIKDAATRLSKTTGWSKSEIYKLGLTLPKNEKGNFGKSCDGG